jgi:hypothetical protein
LNLGVLTMMGWWRGTVWAPKSSDLQELQEVQTQGLRELCKEHSLMRKRKGFGRACAWKGERTIWF